MRRRTSAVPPGQHGQKVSGDLGRSLFMDEERRVVNHDEVGVRESDGHLARAEDGEESIQGWRREKDRLFQLRARRCRVVLVAYSASPRGSRLALDSRRRQV